MDIYISYIPFAIGIIGCGIGVFITCFNDGREELKANIEQDKLHEAHRERMNICQTPVGSRIPPLPPKELDPETRKWTGDLETISKAYMSGFIDESQKDELDAWMGINRPMYGPTRKDFNPAKIVHTYEPEMWRDKTLWA